MKKKIILILSLIVMAVLVYVLIFSKPKVTVTKVEVKSFDNWLGEDMRGNEVEGSVSRLLQSAREGDDTELQAFWEGELESFAEEDYGVIVFEIEAKNSTIFDTYSRGLLLDEYATESNILVVTSPVGEHYFEFEKLSKTKEDRGMRIYVYTKGKSEQEFEDLIHSMVLQIPYRNKVTDAGSIKVSLKGVPIEFDLE